MFGINEVVLAVLDTPRVQVQVDQWLERTAQAETAPKCAVLLEHLFAPLEVPDDVALQRVSAGCMCCVGQVVLRTQLTRLLRAHRPSHLLLLVMEMPHMHQLVAQLRAGALGFCAGAVRQMPAQA